MLFPPGSTPQTKPRVVITGVGIVTALGIGWKSNAQGFRSGRATCSPVTLFDVSQQRAKLAAQANLPDALPTTKLSPREASRLDRAGKMLIVAAQEAWGQSGWEPCENLPLILGTSAGGMSLGEAYFRQAVQAPNDHRHQLSRAIHYQSHSQGRAVEEAFGFTGPITLIADACATGTSALGHAWSQIRLGRTDRAFAGGYDALSQLVFSGFDSLQALSRTVCKPFDVKRDGLLMGEGAAMFALETLDSAHRRSANILGEIVGYGECIDLHHLTQPHPEGNAAVLSMTRACESARVTPQDIDYINAHGTGTSLNDSAEATAIKRWAGNDVVNLPVSSTKASTGHSLGAAGVVEAAACLMTLREQWLPPQTTLETPDPICAFPIVRQPTDARVNTVLSNSFGFGGVNSTIILRRWA